jgi:hypothetical protein
MTSELTKLKNLWRHSFTNEDREFWHQQFLSHQGNLEVVRSLLRKKLKIDLRQDHQLANFIDWESKQREYELHCRRADLENWQQLLEQPDSGLDANRFQELQLKQVCLLRALAHNQTLGIQAIRTATQLRAFELNRQKFEESQRSKIMAGIDALAQEAKTHPAVRASVEQLRATLITHNLIQKN